MNPYRSRNPSIYHYGEFNEISQHSFNFFSRETIQYFWVPFTYIHNWSLQPSVRIIDLVSHTTYVVLLLILYISGGTYSLMSTPNDRNFSLQIYIYFQSFCQKSGVFCFDVWPGARTLALSVINQHTTY